MVITIIIIIINRRYNSLCLALAHDGADALEPLAEVPAEGALGVPVHRGPHPRQQALIH